MKQEIVRLDLQGVNSYLGKEEGNFILFDTGGHMFMDKKFDNRRETLENELKNHGCNKTNLKLIVLTHGDNDHVTNAAYLREKYNTKIAMHPDDMELVYEPTVEKILENCRYKSIGYKLTFFLMKGFLKGIIKKNLADYSRFKPDFLLEDGFDLSAFEFTAKVIHLPGHTKGSIGILTEQGDFISGDTLTNIRKPDTAPNAYNLNLLLKSVKRLQSMNLNRIYPGHGEPFAASELHFPNT